MSSLQRYGDLPELQRIRYGDSSNYVRGVPAEKTQALKVEASERMLWRTCMRSKQLLVYGCINAGILGWSVLFYFRGEPVRVAVLSALLSLLILNGTAWFMFRRASMKADESASGRPRRPMAFWCGVVLVILGAIPVGSAAWARIMGTKSLMTLSDAPVPLALGTYLIRRHRRNTSGKNPLASEIQISPQNTNQHQP